MTILHTAAFFAAALLACFACNARLGAISGRAHVPQCPTVTSLDSSDVKACRQVIALTQDPSQGCLGLRPPPNADDPTHRLQSSGAAQLDTAEAPAAPASSVGRRLLQPDVPRTGQPAGLLCCAAAQMFMAMRCNCQQSLDLQIVNRLADEAARCALLPSGAADVTRPEEPAALMAASASQVQVQQQAPQPQPQPEAQDPAQGEHSSSSSSSSSSGGGGTRGSGCHQGGTADRPQDPVPGSMHSASSGSIATAAGGTGQQVASQHDAPIRLYVAVISMAANRDRRDAVRATWGSDKRLHRLVFVCAKPRSEGAFDALRAEAVRMRDVVIVPHVWEHYDNITHQTFEATRAAALDAAMTHLLKVDDDSYVRVALLMDALRQMPAAYAFMGYMEQPGGAPHRDPKNRWYVSPKEWPSDKYPPWAHGAGYVLTADLVREIAAGAALKPQQHRLFKLEDIAMGSWVEHVGRERKVKIQYIEEQRFSFFQCSAYDLVSHYMSPGLMYCASSSGGRCCSQREAQLSMREVERLDKDAGAHRQL